MELLAAIEALKILDPRRPARVVSDSAYVVTGITSWIASWKRKGWKTAAGGNVLNRDLWEEIDRLAGRWPPESLRWTRVRGHDGHAGNERADRIAVSFAQGSPIDLYNGPLKDYLHGPLEIR
jgi:ribonuclease HI